MDGYVNFTLSISPKGAYKSINIWPSQSYLLICLLPGAMAEPCYYRSYRDEDGKLSAFYWKLLVVRLAFVVIFEVLFSQSYLSNAISCWLISFVFSTSYLECAGWLTPSFLTSQRLWPTKWSEIDIWPNKYYRIRIITFELPNVHNLIFLLPTPWWSYILYWILYYCFIRHVEVLFFFLKARRFTKIVQWPLTFVRMFWCTRDMRFS